MAFFFSSSLFIVGCIGVGLNPRTRRGHLHRPEFGAGLVQVQVQRVAEDAMDDLAAIPEYKYLLK